MTYKLSSPLGSVSRRESLLFDHSMTAEEEEAKFQTATQTLRDLCKSSKDDIRPETPRLFANLVRQMRTLDESNMKRLYQNAGSMCSGAE